MRQSIHVTHLSARYVTHLSEKLSRINKAQNIKKKIMSITIQHLV